MSRDSNKQGLIDLISGELRISRGCLVISSPGDADVDIAKAAVGASLTHHHNTTLIGEDTDLLILLLTMDSLIASTAICGRISQQSHQPSYVSSWKKTMLPIAFHSWLFWM